MAPRVVDRRRRPLAQRRDRRRRPWDERIKLMPVLRTTMRVPGGDAVQHVYRRTRHGRGRDHQRLARAVRRRARRARHAHTLEDRLVGVDSRAAIITARGPSRWAANSYGSTERIVTEGHAREGPFPPLANRGRA